MSERLVIKWKGGRKKEEDGREEGKREDVGSCKRGHVRMTGSI